MSAHEKSIITSCPTCRTSHEVSYAAIGTQITCTSCGERFDAVKFDKAILTHAFCEIALKNQLIDENQIEKIISEEKRLKQQGTSVFLADILVNKKLITAEDRNRLFIAAVRKLNKQFADLAIVKGFLTRDHADQALMAQAEAFKTGKLALISDILMKKQFLDHQQCTLLLHELQQRKNEVDAGRNDEIYDKSGMIPLIALIAVDKEIVTRQQFEEALKIKRELERNGRYKNFEDILVESVKMPVKKMVLALKVMIRKLGKKFASVVIKNGFADKADIEKALVLQSESFNNNHVRLLCDILVASNIISEQERDAVYANYQGARRDQLQKVAEKVDAFIRMASNNVAPLPPLSPTGEPSVIGPSTLDNHTFENEDNRDKLIGELAVTYKLITQDQFDEVLSEQAALQAQEKPATLEDLLIHRALLKRSDISSLLNRKKFFDMRDLDLAFGNIAIKKKMAPQEEVKKALVIQAKAYEKSARIITVGDILVKSGVMALESKNEIWTLQNRLETDKGHIDAMEDMEEEVLLDEPEISISISEDSLSAHVDIHKDISEDIEMSLDEWVQDIKNKIEEKGILYGVINDSLIAGCLKSAVMKKKSFKVASGEPPQPGKIGTINYHFETDFRKAGVLNEKGFIDFRDRGDVPFAKEGGVLAELTPTVQGKSGYNIFGTLLDVPELPDVHLRCGPGAELSENELKAFATIDGMPNLSLKDEISVLQELVIQGDVDYETGHIDFKGNVIVEGAIREGFRVKAVNLTANEIIGGEIDVTGDVNVSVGIIDAHVKAEGDIQAMYMYNATVEAFGDLLIQKEIMDSQVMISGMCQSSNCKIINSQISARKGFQVSQIGTDVSAPCRIRSGVNDHLDHVVNQLKEGLKQKKKALESLQDDIVQQEKLGQEEQTKLDKYLLNKENLLKAREKGERALEELVKKGEQAGISILEGQMVKVLGTLEAVDRQIEETGEKYRRITEIVNAGREKVGQIVCVIEQLNEEIRLISSKVDSSERNAMVKVTGQIASKTIIMGTKSSIVLQDNIKGAMINEIRIVDQESKGAPRWEMNIRKIK